MHVRYRLVHLCFLNEGVNKNNSLRIFSPGPVFLSYVCGTVSFSASAVLVSLLQEEFEWCFGAPSKL